jgi:hypothetical protein
MRALAATLRDLRARGRTAELVDARYRGQVVVRCAPGEKPELVGPTRDKI